MGRTAVALAGIITAASSLVACNRDLVGPSVSYDKETLNTKYQSIEALVSVRTCADSSACAQIGIGSKPCGGPWRYVVYSRSSVDESELQRRVEDLFAFEKEYNRLHGIGSDCSVAREARPACVRGACVDLNAAQPVGTVLREIPSPATAAALVEPTNAERARAGLPRLRSDARLMQAARLHAEQMARAGRLDHTLPRGRYPRPEDRLAAVGYRWQAWAENIAFGDTDPSSVVNGWMRSPGHRANILNSALTEIGVASAVGSRGRSYHVQIFGRPRR